MKKIIILCVIGSLFFIASQEIFACKAFKPGASQEELQPLLLGVENLPASLSKTSYEEIGLVNGDQYKQQKGSKAFSEEIIKLIFSFVNFEVLGKIEICNLRAACSALKYHVDSFFLNNPHEASCKFFVVAIFGCGSDNFEKYFVRFVELTPKENQDKLFEYFGRWFQKVRPEKRKAISPQIYNDLGTYIKCPCLEWLAIKVAASIPFLRNRRMSSLALISGGFGLFIFPPVFGAALREFLMMYPEFFGSLSVLGAAGCCLGYLLRCLPPEFVCDSSYDPEIESRFKEWLKFLIKKNESVWYDENED